MSIEPPQLQLISLGYLPKQEKKSLFWFHRANGSHPEKKQTAIIHVTNGVLRDITRIGAGVQRKPRRQQDIFNIAYCAGVHLGTGVVTSDLFMEIRKLHLPRALA